MKNKVMIFASNGVMLKEISHDNIDVINSWNIKVGDKGEISCRHNISFIKKDRKPLNKEDLQYLEVYAYSTLVFKGYGIYYSSRHSAPYIFAEIEGELFKIDIQGSLEEHLTILQDCE